MCKNSVPWRFGLCIMFTVAHCLSALALTWPIEGQDPRQLAGLFGDWRHGTSAFYFHSGVDIPGKEESIVVTAKPGVVRSIWHAGTAIRIQTLGQNEYFTYGHINVVVSIGDTLAEGDMIGKDLVTPAFYHLHFRKPLDNSGAETPAENPLNPAVIGGLYTDISDPIIVSLDPPDNHFDLRSNDGSNGGGYPEMDRDPPLIAGKIDIVARAYDDNDSPPEKQGGICRIGYTIKNMATDQYYYAPDRPWWLVKFEAGGLPFPNSQELKETVYDDTLSDQHKFYYIVTNDLTGWQGSSYIPYTGLSKDGCWNTRQKDGGDLDDDARWNDEARFPDGRYEIYVRAEDRYENLAVLHPSPDDDDSGRGVAGANMDVQVDNFAPYVQELKIWYLYGEPGAQDTAFVYHAKWEPLYNGRNVLEPIHEEAAPNADLQFTVKFSEYITGLPCPSYINIRFVHENGAAHYQGSFRFPVYEPCAEFTGSILPYGGPPLNEAPFGRYTVEIKADDLAGNYLDVDPSVPAIRDVNGGWNDASYDPENNAPDTNHYFTVAPALWATQRTGGGADSVVGYRKDGTNEPFPYGLGSGRGFCASDPVDGGCWLFSSGAGQTNLKKITAAGTDVPSGPVAGQGKAEWVGVEHATNACWIVKSSPSEIRVVRFWKENNTWHSVGLGIDGDDWAFRSASLDQRKGELWVLQTYWGSYPVPDTGRLKKIRFDDEGETPQLVCAIDEELDMPDIPVEFDYGGVTASPHDSSSWVALVYDDCYSFIWPLTYELRKYNSSATSYSVHVSQSEVVSDMSSPIRSGNYYPAVCGFSRYRGCVSTYVVSQEFYSENPWDPNYFVSQDRLVVITPAGVIIDHDIKIDGCYTHCRDEYIDDFHMSASPKLGGLWLARHHMSPPGGGQCQNINDPRTYLVNFMFLKATGSRERLFSGAFPNCTTPDELHELGDIGVMCISACAGALWDQWQQEPGAQMIAQAVDKDLALHTPPQPFVYELRAIYPNPCKSCPGVTIEYSVGEQPGPVRLDIYNLGGQLVQRLVSGDTRPGIYRTDWNLLDLHGQSLPSAAYIFQMRGNDYVARKRFVVIR